MRQAFTARRAEYPQQQHRARINQEEEVALFPSVNAENYLDAMLVQADEVLMKLRAWIAERS